jgi:hypothetical protein
MPSEVIDCCAPGGRYAAFQREHTATEVTARLRELAEAKVLPEPEKRNGPRPGERAVRSTNRSKPAAKQKLRSRKEVTRW